MFFEIDNTTFGVKFTRVGNRTFAELMEVKKSGLLTHTNIVGEVGLFYLDTYVWSTGRKLALTNLIEEMSKKMQLTKENRAEIWTRYFQEYKK